MRFFLFCAYLLGFRRILFLVLILMAVAIAQHQCSSFDEVKRVITVSSTPSRNRGDVRPSCSRVPATVRERAKGRPPHRC